MIDMVMYALYIILGIAPFSLMRYYPFYDKLRIKPRYFWCIFSGVLAIETIWFIAIEYNGVALYVSDNELLRLCFYLVYFLMQFIFLKEKPSRFLIIWALCMIFSSTFTAFTFWIDGLIKSEIPFLIKNISMIILMPPFIWLGLRFIINKMIPLINQSEDKVNRMISALLLLIFGMGLITARELPFNAVQPFSVFAIRLLACIITIVVCNIFSSIIESQKEKYFIIKENKQKEKMLEVSTQQFIALSEKIEETRRARHDLKFHMSAIKSFVSTGDYDGLSKYLESDNLLPSDTVLSYCDHPTINILLSYYGNIAATNHIQFDVKVKVLAELFLSNSEIWVLLGNLLENAIEATKLISESDKSIVTRMDANNNSLVLTVDNSFDENNLNRNGETFYSTKINGGIGLNSIAFLAEKYNGLATFETKDGFFLSSVTMYRTKA